jgi:hypothetical protein
MKNTLPQTRDEHPQLIEGVSPHDLLWTGIKLTAAVISAVGLAFWVSSMLARI